MGYDAIGTDLEPRIVEYSIENITWLRQRFERADGYMRIEVGDATDHKWPKTVTHVASELYLGRPLQKLPPPAELKKIINDVNTIHVKFLKNLTAQLPKNSRLCLALPAWRGHNQFYHLPLLDQLANLGYNRVSFVHASNQDLIYHRPGQIVARELVVLETI